MLSPPTKAFGDSVITIFEPEIGILPGQIGILDQYEVISNWLPINGHLDLHRCPSGILIDLAFS